MSRLPSLALTGAATLVMLLAGCDAFTPPPAQLQAVLTLEAGAGDQGDTKQRRDLTDQIVQFLGIKGIDNKNARVRFDEASKTYHFEIFGKQQIAQALLEQVAKGVKPLEVDRSWSANVKVAPLEHLDKLLGSKERSFPVRASWKNADIDTYVIQTPALGFAMPTISPTGEMVREPKTALCMLSFKPEPALPKLEGTVDEVYGISPDSVQAQLARRLQAGQVMSVPHDVTFDDATLADVFKDAPMAKDGKLMFQFAMLNDVNVLEFGGKEPAMDMGGHTQAKCVAALAEKHPKLAAIIDKMALLENIKSFGPARMIALPVPAK